MLSANFLLGIIAGIVIVEFPVIVNILYKIHTELELIRSEILKETLDTVN
jgi:hypothetical protein